jgi:hypothetical protein
MGRRARTGEVESHASARSKVTDQIAVFPPDLCGDFNMRIDRNGTWYYRGTPIGRHALVKLFSTVLRRDEEGVHWLTTPVENGRIEVEDSAFIAVELLAEGEGQSQIIRFRTNVDDTVTLDDEHPLRVAQDAETGEPRPQHRNRTIRHCQEPAEGHPRQPGVGAEFLARPDRHRTDDRGQR